MYFRTIVSLSFLLLTLSEVALADKTDDYIKSEMQKEKIPALMPVVAQPIEDND